MDKLKTTLIAECLKLNQIVIKKPGLNTFITVNLIFNNENETLITKNTLKNLDIGKLIFHFAR
jgi:hypothetical protein